MMKQQGKELLTEKLTGLGYPEFEIVSEIDEVPMLYIQGCRISGVAHALALEDERLKSLIIETLEIAVRGQVS